MTNAIAFQFKWPMTLLWAVIILLKLDEAQSSSSNCSKYNNSSLYDGEICGTDGITYANKRYLSCLNNADDERDVATAHPGCCLPGEKFCRRNYIYCPVCGYDGKSWSNLDSLRCHNSIYNTTIERKFNGTCDGNSDISINEDPCTKHGFNQDGLNPVCANNGFTYQNVAQVKCLRERSNPDLRVVSPGGCSLRRVRKLFKDPELICEISKTHFEWNPLCGDDGKTYPNPFIFICVKVNEKTDLKVKFRGECNTSIHKACIRSHSNVYTKEDRVCANNGMTFDSIDHLLCQTNRDKYLSFKHEGKCIGPNDNPCGAVPDENSRYPICATDNVSYISIEAMWCVNRQNDTALHLLHDGPCLHN